SEVGGPAGSTVAIVAVAALRRIDILEAAVRPVAGPTQAWRTLPVRRHRVGPGEPDGGQGGQRDAGEAQRVLDHGSLPGGAWCPRRSGCRPPAPQSSAVAPPCRIRQRASL